ncbi:MAG: FG-GAP-like repeat-containing protein, partial [Solirubrobacterales bacterium]
MGIKNRRATKRGTFEASCQTPTLEPLEARVLMNADPLVAEASAVLESSLGQDAVVVSVENADAGDDVVALALQPAQDLRIVPDTGGSAVDGVTRSSSLVLTGYLPDASASVALTDMTTGTNLGAGTISGSNFTANLSITTAGLHLIRVRNTATDGQYADSFFNLVLDQAAPTIAGVSAASSGSSGVDGFSVEFSEATNVADLISNGSILSAVSLVRTTGAGDVAVNLSAGEFSYDSTSHVLKWHTGDGSALAAGAYRVEVRPGLVKDTAGNTMVGGGQAVQLGTEQRLQVSGVDIQVTAYSVPTLADWNSDGKTDLIVGEKADDLSGKVRVYLNSGTNASPVYGTFFYVQASGADLVVSATGCLGAYPRVVDWNQDNKKDLLIGLADGTIRLYLNTGTAANPTFGSSSLIQAGDSGAKVNIDVGDRAAFDVVDWNNDGAMDLVAGALDGKVHVFLNRTTSGAPDLASPVTVKEGTGDLVVSSGRSSVDVCDFNADGRKDLVLGNTDAQVIFYANVGTDAAPVFDGHATILGTTGGVRSRPFVSDINSDGIPDLLLGTSDGLVRRYLGASSDTNYQAQFVVSSTVGYTTVFSNISAVANRRAQPVVAAQAGTLDSISIYHQGGTGHAILAVYSDASGLPGTLLGATSSTLINSTAGWQTIALQSPVAVSAGQTVWLAWVFENDPGMRWMEGTPGRASSTATWSGGMPESFGAATTNTGLYSIYATYSDAADVTAPGSVGNLTATAGDGQINLSWTNPGDSDFAGVKVVRKEGSSPTSVTDGTVVYTGSAEQYTNTGLTNGTTYYYAVFSYDEVPNYSSGATTNATPAEAGASTVGYTTVFSNISGTVNRRAVPVAVSETGTLGSITIYHQGGTGNAILAVYNDASGLPGTSLGATASTPINSTEGWQTFALQSPVAVSAGQTIWLAWVFENDPGMRWMEGTPGRASSTATWSGGMPDSFGAATTNSGLYS